MADTTEKVIVGIAINGQTFKGGSGGGSVNIQYGTEIPTTLAEGEVYIQYFE